LTVLPIGLLAHDKNTAHIKNPRTREKAREELDIIFKIDILLRCECRAKLRVKFVLILGYEMDSSITPIKNCKAHASQGEWA